MNILLDSGFRYLLDDNIAFSRSTHSTPKKGSRTITKMGNNDAVKTLLPNIPYGLKSKHKNEFEKDERKIERRQKRKKQHEGGRI